jgi:hypothetical protein
MIMSIGPVGQYIPDINENNFIIWLTNVISTTINIYFSFSKLLEDPSRI